MNFQPSQFFVSVCHDGALSAVYPTAQRAASCVCNELESKLGNQLTRVSCSQRRIRVLALTCGFAELV